MEKKAWEPGRYPSARRGDTYDVYKSAKQGEVKIHDPYQWLETSSEETTTWIKDQVEFTNEYLNRIPDRTRLKTLMMENVDFEKFSAPSRKGDKRWYWYYNAGLQPQSVLYRSVDEKLPDFSKIEGPGGEVFFDPNLLSDDGTAAIAATAFSEDGKYFAYGISLAGSDFFTAYVRKTSSPFRAIDGKRPAVDEDIVDTLRFIKFSSLEWTQDSKGFFYQRFPDRESHGALGSDKAGTETEADLNATLMYHRLGTSQSEDVLVWKDDENPEWLFGAQVTEDGKYMAMYISKDTSRKHKLWITDLTQNEIGPNMKWLKLIDDYEAEYSILGNDGPILYLQTNKDSPRDKVISIDISQDPPLFKDIIPEDPNATLVQDELYLYTKSGQKLRRLAEDFVGSISVVAKEKDTWFFVTTTGFTTPGIIYRYDFNAPEDTRWTQYRETKVKGIKADDFLVHQEWYKSKDGTRIPMFIVRPKHIQKDGTASAIQYGYGGFSYSVSPAFSATILTYIKAYDAIYVVANIRGGSEFGEEWHLAGTKERKINVFDDFIAATEHLTKTGWVAPGKVAINGASNGGLLIAACLNRAPQGTFGAGVADVGVLDMLKVNHERFYSGEDTELKHLVGRAWTSDYGDPHVPEDFDFIYPISPIHNVPDQELPPTLLLTADHDDRVVPLHTFKHTATLQHKLAKNPNPLLVRIETSAGHGAGKSTEKKVTEAADKWSFVAYSLGLQWREEKAQQHSKKDEL
ncbi:hypothetical protein FRC17_003398 [Serendipita sp. 399]|nr:hypothetical protein FRC17_003398 [Serendipita sp. 399]